MSHIDDLNQPRAWTEKDLVCYKYIDDFLGIEKIYTGTGVLSISQHKTVNDVRVRKSELFYKTVEQNAKNIGLSINLKKAHLLCISSAIYSDINSFIKIDGEIIKNQDQMKILLFLEVPQWYQSMYE